MSQQSGYINFGAVSLSIFLTLSGLLAPLHAQGRAGLCADVFRGTAVSVWERVAANRDREPRPVQFENTISYLNERRQMESSGVVRSRFDRELDTRIYYSATGVPNLRGESPLVDPDAKAVYVFIHGSGTAQSGGRNFIGTMNTLASLGFAGLSVDLPFHMDGPISEKFYETDEFLNWFSKVVAKAKSSGKPVFLVGHSFGPQVIGEFLYRNPKAVDGAVMISPVGFDETQRKWYDKHTSKMKFGGDVPENDLGGEWSSIVERGFSWMFEPRFADPTLVNPALRVRMLSGDREEYLPAPLGRNGLPNGRNTYNLEAAFHKKFANAEVSIEQGIGHYIFNHSDVNGNNVVMRELLATTNLQPSDEFQLRKDMGRRNEFLPETDKLAVKAATDRLFKAWLDKTYDAQMSRRLRIQTDDVMAKQILADYEVVRREREITISREIAVNAPNFPEFERRFKDQLELIGKNGKAAAQLFSPYLLAVDPSAGSEN